MKDLHPAFQALIVARRKRVEASDEQSLALLTSLFSEFSGRELATALMAEGFGTAREVRQAVHSLGEGSSW